MNRHYSVRPLARRTDPASSHSAAQSMTAHAPTQGRKIIQAIRAKGPSTGGELAAFLGLEMAQISRRMVEQERAGLIRRSCIRQCTVRHRAMLEWELNESAADE